MRLRSLACALLFLLACGSAPAPVAAPDPCADLAPLKPGATVFDLNCSFSPSNNPNGPWRVGFTRARSLAPDQFVLSSRTDTSNPVGLWHPDLSTYYPYVAWNSTALARVDATDSWAVRPHEVAMEAAPGGQLSMIQFIAPTPGPYFIRATFEGIHFRHSTTDVHIRLGATSLFDGVIDGYGGNTAFHVQDGSSPVASFSQEVAVQAGDVLSFSVGIGPDEANANDTTGLLLRLEAR